MRRLAHRLSTLCSAVSLVLAGCSEPTPPTPHTPPEADAIIAAIDATKQEFSRRDPSASFHDVDLAALRAKVRGGADVRGMREGVVFHTFEREEIEGEGAREFLASVFSVGFKPASVQLRRAGDVVAEATIPRVEGRRVSERATWYTFFIYFVTTNPEPAAEFANYPWFELDRPMGSYELVFVDEGGQALKPVSITLGAEHGRVR